MNQYVEAVFWFRRDLRLEDNAGLYHALSSGLQVIPVFIFDTLILDDLKDKSDPRVSFIHEQLTRINSDLNDQGASLLVEHGTPLECFRRIMDKHKNIKVVYCNEDYEPYARKRDSEIASWLLKQNIRFVSCKDQVVFSKTEVLKDNGLPYTVFTPYKNKWLKTLNEFYLKPYPSESKLNKLCTSGQTSVPKLESLGFSKSDKDFPEKKIDLAVLRDYHLKRDYPAIMGTSRLSVHLRFGTISIRKLAKLAIETNQSWLNELIWRDFYQMILWHFPNSVINNFKPEYDAFPWQNKPKDFEKWKLGNTGFALVDAGMRELNATGFMHNRVRMITASFLCKHLMIDWRWGEAYFAEKLLDYDLASNVGGWQWAASSGCDAAPYFRVFNPDLQAQKFDPKFEYIRKWVPEFESPAYVRIIDHKFARDRVLRAFNDIFKKTTV